MTHRGHTFTHTGVCARGAGFRDGVFKHQLYDTVESLICVDVEFSQLLHHLVDVFVGQFVKDSPDILKKFLHETYTIILLNPAQQRQN